MHSGGVSGVVRQLHGECAGHLGVYACQVLSWNTCGILHVAVQAGISIAGLHSSSRSRSFAFGPLMQDKTDIQLGSAARAAT